VLLTSKSYSETSQSSVEPEMIPHALETEDMIVENEAMVK
jgi:hypothetical protein